MFGVFFDGIENSPNAGKTAGIEVVKSASYWPRRLSFDEFKEYTACPPLASPSIGAIPRSDTRPVEMKWDAIEVIDRMIVTNNRYHTCHLKTPLFSRKIGKQGLNL